MTAPHRGYRDGPSWQAGSAGSTRTARPRTVRWFQPRQLIITFHGLGEPPHQISDSERRVWVPLEWFEAIIDAPLPPGVGLAFDDGNASDVQLALPALIERGMVARFFPLTGRIGAPGYLDAGDLITLRDAGMKIGSQGVNHRAWRTFGDEELLDELKSSRQMLADVLGRNVTEAACPFGSYDRRVLRALRSAGYERAFNSDGGASRAGAWPSPRTTITRELPLKYWLGLATQGPSRRPAPLLQSKRLIKRLR